MSINFETLNRWIAEAFQLQQVVHIFLRPC